jgi:hypothetical protein
MGRKVPVSCRRPAATVEWRNKKQQALPLEGPARGTLFWTESRRANWKVASQPANMGNCPRSERIRTTLQWEIRGKSLLTSLRRHHIRNPVRLLTY